MSNYFVRNSSKEEKRKLEGKRKIEEKMSAMRQSTEVFYVLREKKKKH